MHTSHPYNKTSASNTPSTTASPERMPTSPPATKRSLFSSTTLLLSLLLLPLSAILALYLLHGFDQTADPFMTAPLRNDRVLSDAEFVGEGRLDKPEDVAYHRESGFIYTGCEDGWIKRVRLNDSMVEDLVNTGGRPLGIAFGRHGEIIVADAYKGLLNIGEDGRKMEVLTEEAEGVSLKLTDAVDVADDGMIYFTDASYKYYLHDFILDILEAKPYSRLLSYDPTTKTTRVLLTDLYFANGISLSPDQSHLVFCETPLRRCSKYYIRGEKRGNVETFIEHLPGFPDNFRYDGEGHYWLAFPSSYSTEWQLLSKYPILRKMLFIALNVSGWRIHIMKSAKVFQLDLNGKLIAQYGDPGLSHVTTGVKIGNYLYCGTILSSHITRLNLDLYPARPVAR